MQVGTFFFNPLVIDHIYDISNNSDAIKILPLLGSVVLKGYLELKQMLKCSNHSSQAIRIGKGHS